MLAIIILAAGKGKRMLNPEKAKVMYELRGKPLIEYVVDLSLSVNSSKIIIIIGHQKKSVIDFISSRYKTDKITFAHQDIQLGTGDAVMKAGDILKNFQGDVLILSGDVPLLRKETIEQFIKFHSENGYDASLISTRFENPFGYGRIIRDIKGKFIEIKEEKDASDEERKIQEINSGIYLINDKYLFDALKKLEPDNAQREYYLTDTFHYFKEQGLKIGAILTENCDEITGINTKEQLDEMESIFSK